MQDYAGPHVTHVRECGPSVKEYSLSPQLGLSLSWPDQPTRGRDLLCATCENALLSLSLSFPLSRAPEAVKETAARSLFSSPLVVLTNTPMGGKEWKGHHREKAHQDFYGDLSL